MAAWRKKGNTNNSENLMKFFEYLSLKKEDSYSYDEKIKSTRTEYIMSG